MFEDDLDGLDTADLLAAASEFGLVQERAAVRTLEAALAYADRNAVGYDDTHSGEVLPGTEQIKVYGGVGCPGVAEFAPIEFGAVTRMSTGAAASFIGEALALRHRLPRIWAAVLAGNAVAWRARGVARACLSLSLEAAASAAHDGSATDGSTAAENRSIDHDRADPSDNRCGTDDRDAPVDTTDPDQDVFRWRTLAGSLPARLAVIKQHAYSTCIGAGSDRRNRHTLYVHLTDQALASGTGVLRVEELGPLLINQLSELLGHDQIVVKPVIDLHDQVSVHSYEIPSRIRERVRLRHPVDMFPYSGAEATTRMDQDHITPYDRAGPPQQTNTDNLIPQGRLHHRAKTFGGWKSRRLPTGAIEWTSPHGFRFHVDHTGTHPMPPATSLDAR